MNFSTFQARLVRNRPVRVDQLLIFLDWGRKKVHPSDFVEFFKTQQAVIGGKKRLMQKGEAQHG